MTFDEREAAIMECMPAVGESFRVNYGKEHRGNRLIHIRAIVDDEYIVYRYWKNGYWVYMMTDPTFFYVGIESSVLTKAKSRSNA